MLPPFCARVARGPPPPGLGAGGSPIPCPHPRCGDAFPAGGDPDDAGVTPKGTGLMRFSDTASTRAGLGGCEPPGTSCFFFGGDVWGGTEGCLALGEGGGTEVGGCVLRLLSSPGALRGGIKPAVVFCLCSAPSLQSSEVSRPTGPLLSSVRSPLHGLSAAEIGGGVGAEPPPRAVWGEDGGAEAVLAGWWWWGGGCMPGCWMRSRGAAIGVSLTFTPLPPRVPAG